LVFKITFKMRPITKGTRPVVSASAKMDRRSVVAL
jgi:hypothetical protein